jgi:oligoribonuclease
MGSRDPPIGRNNGQDGMDYGRVEVELTMKT